MHYGVATEDLFSSSSTPSSISPSVELSSDTVVSSECASSLVPRFSIDEDMSYCSICRLDFTSPAEYDVHLKDFHLEKDFGNFTLKVTEITTDSTGTSDGESDVKKKTDSKYTESKSRSEDKRLSSGVAKSSSSKSRKHGGSSAVCASKPIDLSSISSSTVATEHKPLPSSSSVKSPESFVCEVCHKKLKSKDALIDHATAMVKSDREKEHQHLLTKLTGREVKFSKKTPKEPTSSKSEFETTHPSKPTAPTSSDRSSSSISHSGHRHRGERAGRGERGDREKTGERSERPSRSHHYKSRGPYDGSGRGASWSHEGGRKAGRDSFHFTSGESHEGKKTRDTYAGDDSWRASKDIPPMDSYEYAERRFPKQSYSSSVSDTAVDIDRSTSEKTDRTSSRAHMPPSESSFDTDRTPYFKSYDSERSHSKKARRFDASKMTPVPAFPYIPAPVVTEVVPVPPLALTDYLELLSQEISSFCREIAPSEEVLASRNDLFDRLCSIVKDLYKDTVQLEKFGSCASNLSTKFSDLDLVLSASPAAVDEKGNRISYAENEYVQMLINVNKRIVAEGLGTSEVILSARVPILKFTDAKSKIECDIAFKVGKHKLKSSLFQILCSVDERFRDLVFAVKRWSKSRHTGEATKGTLNSFGHTVLVIHFLQSCSPPILPILRLKSEIVDEKGLRLSPEEEDAWDEEPVKSFKKLNTQSIGELFYEYFRYYASEFDIFRHCVSLRQTHLFELNTFSRKEKFQDRHRTSLCIEDPVDATDNVGRNVTTEAAEFISREFVRAWRMLEAQHTFFSICESADVPLFHGYFPRRRRGKSGGSSGSLHSPLNSSRRAWQKKPVE